jgi:hypothetical protein
MDDSGTPSSALRDWVATWRRAGPALERLKRDELRALDTVIALQQLADAFEHALQRSPMLSTSGLVEQQRILQRLR